MRSTTSIWTSLLADLLAGHGLLEGVGELGLGLTGVGLLLVPGLLDLEVALGLSDASLGIVLGRFLIAVCRRFDDRGVTLGLGALDGGIAGRLGFADLGIAGDFGGALAAEGIEIAHVVTDIADGETDDLKAHVRHVRVGNLADALGEGLAVLIDALDCHGPQDGALGALKGLEGNLGDLPLGLTDELLRRGADGFLGAGDFHLRDAVDGDGDALLGVDLRGLHREGHNLE